MQGGIAATEQTYSAQRRAMVDGQIRTFDVTDARVIRAFDIVPRERFVPDVLRPLAYSDALLTLRAADGKPLRTLMQPMHLARMLQGVAPDANDRALVVAGGAGYAAAILLELCASVVTLESHEELTAAATANCVTGSDGRASAVTGDLSAGHPSGAPFEVILVLGGIETGLDTLLAQLAPGGTLAAVKTSSELNGRRTGRVMLYRPTGGDVSGRAIFDATLPLLPEFRTAPAFTF